MAKKKAHGVRGKRRRATTTTRQRARAKAPVVEQPQRRPVTVLEALLAAAPSVELAETPQTDRERFLLAFMETAKVGLAARAAGVVRQTPYRWAAEDPEFAKAWDQARSIACSLLEDEALRRAVRGTRRPVYQQGRLVGYEQQYSDALLKFLLESWGPDRYTPKLRQEHTGKDGGPVRVVEMTPEQEDAEIRRLMAMTGYTPAEQPGDEPGKEGESNG